MAQNVLNGAIDKWVFFKVMSRSRELDFGQGQVPMTEKEKCVIPQVLGVGNDEWGLVRVADCVQLCCSRFFFLLFFTSFRSQWISEPIIDSNILFSQDNSVWRWQDQV